MRKLVAVGALVFVAASTASCSDPVPPPEQGAAYFTVSARSGEAKLCPLSTAARGNAPAVVGVSQVLDANNVYGRITDGDNGKVKCKVVESSGSFSVQGLVQSTSPATTLSVIATFAAGSKTAPATISVNDQSTGNTYSSADKTCTADVDGGSLGVAAGRIWGHYTCTSVLVPEAQSDCQSSGYFLFENCEQ